MAFEKLQFTKSWENARDFPTYEPSEAQVRADLQLLHDEARDGINRLVDALNGPTAAAQLPFQAQGMTAGTVQDAILEVYGAVQDAAAGTIVAGSVTKEKLAAALLARTYGGRPWVSMNTPGTGQTPDTDFPIGQVWLRPSFPVTNLAGSAWTVSGGTVVKTADNGWKLTGSGSVTTAVLSQNLSALGAAGEKTFVSLRASDPDSQLTGLTLTLNGTSHDLSAGGGVFETALDSQGGLTLAVTAMWPAAALAVGSVTLTHFAVVNAGAAEARLDDCEALSDWPGLLTDLVPFTEVTLPGALFIQMTPGRWYQAAYDTLPVSRGGTGMAAVTAGQMLYANGANSLTALDAPETDGSYLRFQDGGPVWSTAGQVVTNLGSLRIRTGEYTGTGEARTVTLPVEPKLLLIFAKSVPTDLHLRGVTDNPIVLGNGGAALEKYSATTTSGGSASYFSQVSLSGKIVTFSENHYIQDTDPDSIAVKYGNRSGVSYGWAAVY